MPTNFDALKKNRQTQFDRLTSELTKLSTNQGPQEDNRFWKPEVDKAGNGYAVIRFLPAPQGEEIPFVRVWDHGFKGPGGWYIENSLTTLGEKDPVSEYNATLWNSGIEANKEIVRKQKRRLSFISNIYVVKDPANPDNEGKVMLYKYGKKIWDKIELAMNPEFEDETSVNPFDLWEGANFKIKIRNVEGYRNYDKSEFEDPAPLLDDDDELERVWKRESSLQEFVDPKNFKSYDELKAKLNKVLGLDGGQIIQTTAESKRGFDEDDNQSFQPSKPKPKAKVTDVDVEEDDESLDFFKKLAEDD